MGRELAELLLVSCGFNIERGVKELVWFGCDGVSEEKGGRESKHKYKIASYIV